MAELTTLARPYARAAFETARDAGDDGLARWSAMLAFLAGAVETDELAAELEAPSRTPEGKAQLLVDLAGERIDDRGANLVRVLADNGRLPLLPEIAAEFENLKDAHERTLEVEIVSARELSEADVEGLREGLARRFDKRIDVATRVDPDLLGGAVIRAGDTIIDGSVRGRLDRLAHVLTAR